ncbi:MAG: hypothetical protein WDZ38_02610, partial [Balneolaceae bacterium]
ERLITIRYLLLILSALIAFSTPYLLFPDRNIALLQLGNSNREHLNRYLIKRVIRLTWPVYLLFAVLIFVDLNNPLHQFVDKCFVFLNSTFFLTGMAILSLARYSKSGFDSLFWKESDKGRRLRKQMADYFKYPIDPGSIPSLLNTIIIVLTGSLVIVAGSVINQSLGILVELFFMALLFMIALLYYKFLSGQMVINYYSTSSFFLEFFGSNLKGEELTSRREVSQLWWVPKSLKMHIWQFLVQLDRKIPSGRVAAAGHLLVWFIAYQRPDPEFLMYIWLIFALLHHFFSILTIGEEMAPGWLFRWLGSSKTWILSRFWMQLRWVIPLLLSMNLQLFVFGIPEMFTQMMVLLVYLITSFMVSVYGVASLKKEVKL